ncbi:MAG: CHAT domain-containing protein [Cyanobacteria bacterium P01_F01_bin.143]
MTLNLARLCCVPLSLLAVTIASPAIAKQLPTTQINLAQSVPKQGNSNLLQQGQKYYQTGQFAAAANTWQEALVTYQALDQNSKQIQTLNYLSSAYQELGQWQESQNAIANSLDLLSDSSNLDRNTLLLRGQALNNQGKLEFSQGQTETAFKTWQQAISDYDAAGDETGKLIASLNQAQALQAMGKYRQTKSLLEELVTQLRQQPDTLLKAQGLRSLGIALQTIGDPIQSKGILESSLAIAQQLASPQDISAAYFGIGNVAQDLGEYEIALTYYQETIELSLEKITELQAQLNQLSILVKLENWQSAADLVPAIANNLSQLTPSRASIYARVNLAETLMDGTRESKIVAIPEIAHFLGTAVQQARQISDPRAEAYALNQLGKLYQQQNQLSEAQELTEKSLHLAQSINADDITARSATQLGNIRQEQGNIDGAIAAYDISFIKLQSLRSDLVSINSNVQFTFKESIEPTYREYVGLLLQKDDNQENLQKARQVMESLQVAELDNFFRDACLDTYPVVVDEIDVQAAVIYPIILRDRLEVILSLPQQPLRHYSTPLNSDQVETILKQFYSSMSPGYPRNEGLKAAEQVYDWLIRPAEAILQESNSQTLVFVPDGFFRNLPMSALYDGEKYLIENYGVAVSPGLQLFPEGIQGKDLSLLAVGLTEARQGFTSLPGVSGEVTQVTKELDSEVLLDQEFTQDSFRVILNEKSFPIVHLATHGQFSSNPEETFLLTWSDRISIQDFDSLFQQRRLGILEPIELLVMSACQTAAGDNRATLGLAGFALRSGARSTVASLWSVSDRATSDLMQEFYAQLSGGNISKSEAIRQAQLKVLSNPVHKHPYFWSSFILVGNWL